MSTIKAKIKQYMEDRYFKVFLFVIVLTYIPLAHIHFATDTYYTLYDMRPEGHLSSGRLTVYIFCKILQILNINTVIYQQIFTLFFIGASVFTVYKIFNLFGEVCKKSFFLVVLALICICNIYILEWFLFPEMCLYWGIGLIATILAVEITFKNKPISIVYAMLLLCVSLGCYQSNVGIYIILCTTFLILKNKFLFNKQYIYSFIKIYFIAALSSAFTISIPKLVNLLGSQADSVRNASLSIETIFNNLYTILTLQKDVWIENSFLLPKYSTIILVIVAIIGIFYSCLRGKKQFLSYFVIIGTIISNFIMIFAPHLVAGFVWLSPRAIVPISIFVFSVCVIAYYFLDTQKEVFILNSLKMLSLFFIILNIYNIHGITLNHFSTNKIDQEYALMIEEEINNYENMTGNKIEYIATINDVQSQWKYNSIESMAYNVNERAYLNDWSDVTLLNYVTGKNYIKIKFDNEEIKNAIYGKNWEHFVPEEQLFFKDNILYWCKY